MPMTEASPAIRLIVGLGNPGREYAATRHNAGFWWVDALAAELGAVLHPEAKFFGSAGRIQSAGQDVWLLQPQTFMNLSGKSVAALARFLKITPQEMLIVHDELDLLPGEARLKRGGGHAGHNGLRDIAASLGSPETWRLRLGIGHPRSLNLNQSVADFVLHRPRGEEERAIHETITRTLPVLPWLLSGDFVRATQLVNTRPVSRT